DAIQIIQEKRQKDKEKVIRVFSENPDAQIENGRWGPFIRFGKQNVKIPKGTDIEKISYEDVLKWAEADPKGKAKAAAKTATAKKTTKKASTGKSKKERGMKKDLPENIVEDISIAVVLENVTPSDKVWNVYLINEKKLPLINVIVSSKGYGEKDGVEVKTTVLRHFLGDIEANTSRKIEAIDPQVFGLTNEYWLSYYIDKTIYDKKYIFLPESIVDENLIKVPLVNKAGIVIGGSKQ